MFHPGLSGGTSQRYLFFWFHVLEIENFGKEVNIRYVDLNIRKKDLKKLSHRLNKRMI